MRIEKINPINSFENPKLIKKVPPSGRLEKNKLEREPEKHYKPTVENAHEESPEGIEVII